MPTTAVDRIEVAAGVLRDTRGRILVGQRIVKDLYYGKWEFPGGKLEPGESARQALVRELREELGIEVGETEPLIQLCHDYPDRKVRLNVLNVMSYSGEPRGREGQAIKWVEPDELDQLDFLEANRPIMTAVDLPDYVYIADASSADVAQILSAVESLVASSEPAIIHVKEFGENERASAHKKLLVTKMLARAGTSAVSIYLQGNLQSAADAGVQGAHIDASLIANAPDRNQFGTLRMGASCHNAAQVRHAGELELDYIFVGPVKENATDPHAVLGWSGFSDLVSHAGMPAYAIGGLSMADRDVARQLGGQGVVLDAGAWDGGL